MSRKNNLIPSSLSPKNLEEISRVFHIDACYHPCLPKDGETILNPPTGSLGVYYIFLKAGLRFPVFPFLNVVLSHYRLQLGQLTPNGFHKIICFVLLHRALGLELSLTLFRYFYIIMPSGNWVSMSLRHGLVDMIEGLPSSIKHWKEEYFFVDEKALGERLVAIDEPTRGPDSPPSLTEEEMRVAELLSGHCVKWVDPDEVVLATAGLSTKWASTGKYPTLTAGNQTVSFLDRLFRKEYPHPLSITEIPMPVQPDQNPLAASATHSAGSSIPRVESEVKTSTPSDSDLSDTMPLSKSMKHVLRNTHAWVGAKSGGRHKRGLYASSEQNPIDVDDLPESRLRRRMGPLREKSITSRTEPSSPSSESTQKVDPSPDSGLQDCPVSADADLSKAVPPTETVQVLL